MIARMATLALTASLLLAACETATNAAIPAMTAKAGISCQELGEYASQLTDELAAAYAGNEAIQQAQQVGTAAAFIPGIGLIAAGGTVVAGWGRVSTADLRIARDRATDRLFMRIIGDEC